MQRIVEAELMEDQLQVQAYAEADFDAQHSQIIELIGRVFSGVEFSGEILDLGCGPGDVSFRIAHRFSKARITGIDGSAAMIRQAKLRQKGEKAVNKRMHFIQASIPGAEIPKNNYELIISTSFLHHLHRPEVLWQTIIEHSQPGARIFVADLCRPENVNAARQIVNEYASNEPEILRQDFYNSLLAAFTPAEVEEQLFRAGLKTLSVEVDRYIVIYGEINQ